MNALREGYPPVVMAHRGASSAFRENTIDAFRGAATLGADWVELDVRFCVDGTPVVHHDPQVAGDGPVVAEVAADALPTWVPTLDAALAACEQPGRRSGRPLGVNIEIKSDPRDPDHDPTHRFVPAVVESIRRHLDRERTLVSSFDPSALAAVRLAAPELPTALLALDLNDLERVLDVAVAGNHVALNPWDGFVTDELVAAAHARGLAVYPWTVDDPERMEVLCRLGVDGIITNLPDLCAEVVDRCSGDRYDPLPHPG